MPEHKIAARVLIVDDNPTKLSALLAVLQTLDVELITANSGMEALRKLLAQDFAVVLLDVNMPLMSGLETAEIIRSRPRSEYLPIIFITAEALSIEQQIQGYQVGAVDYVFSPVLPQMLRAKVANFVDLYRLREQSYRYNAALLNKNEEITRLLDETRQAHTLLEESQLRMMQMEKLSALGTLVGGVSHEINNPLMGLMNFVEFAESHVSDPKIQNVLGQALTEIKRIEAIVSNMLLYVRSNADPKDSCQLLSMVTQSLSLLDGEFKKANIQIHTDIAEHLPLIACQPDSLLQVLVNLLLNARDALAGREQPRIDLVARQLDTGVELTVSDNGPGIPEAILPQIFDPFFTTKAPGKGTGLGLSVSQRLIEAAGANIIAYNKQGNGGCCMKLQFEKKSQASKNLIQPKLNTEKT